MLSVIVATHESERALVPTLSALVPGATAGLIADVTVADAQSTDATAEVADIAGCRFLSSDAPLGARLKSAAAASRGTWLLFLPAGSVLGANWVDAVQTFIAQGNVERAATFRTNDQGLFGALRRSLGGLRPEHGLLVSRRMYDAFGNEVADANAPLPRHLGSRRIVTLDAVVTIRRTT
jgi:hypothetical protein